MTKTKISFVALLFILLILWNYWFILSKQLNCWLLDDFTNKTRNSDFKSSTNDEKNTDRNLELNSVNEQEFIPEKIDNNSIDSKVDEWNWTSIENKKFSDISDSSKYGVFNQMLVDKSWFNNWNKNQFSNFWWSENIEKVWDTFKIKYPKWSTVPSEIPRWGAWFIYDTWKKYNKLVLSYNLKFEPWFDFVKWWKLPWLCWWDCSRWWMATDKWFSVRFVWRKSWYLDYLIYTPRSNAYWDYSWKQIFKMIPWKEYTIKQEIVLNDIWKNNWILNIYVEWNKVYSKNDILYRTTDKVSVTSLLFATFFWWKWTDWASTKDTFIYLKDFKLAE